MRKPSLRLTLAVLALALCAQRGHGQTAPTPPAAPAECPRLEVSCPEAGTGGVPITFSVGNAPGAGVTYEWIVSAGTITSGQGTQTITVDTTGIWNQPVTATVEAKGLPQSCPNTASCAAYVVTVACGNGKIDQYGNIRFNDEKARLDNLAIELQNSPDMKGYLIAYAGRRARVGEARRRAERAKRYLTTARGIAPDRVVTLDGGHRENLTVELLIVPKDGPAPQPMPTVDPSKVTFIRASTKRRARRR